MLNISPTMPPIQLVSVYAFLLGGGGGEDDVDAVHVQMQVELFLDIYELSR